MLVNRLSRLLVATLVASPVAFVGVLGLTTAPTGAAVYHAVYAADGDPAPDPPPRTRTRPPIPLLTRPGPEPGPRPRSDPAAGPAAAHRHPAAGAAGAAGAEPPSVKPPKAAPKPSHHSQAKPAKKHHANQHQSQASTTEADDSRSAPGSDAAGDPVRARGAACRHPAQGTQAPGAASRHADHTDGIAHLQVSLAKIRPLAAATDSAKSSLWLATGFFALLAAFGAGTIVARRRKAAIADLDPSRVMVFDKHHPW